MSDPPEHQSPQELTHVELLLARRRPVPGAAFRRELGLSVAGEIRRRHITARPERLWARAVLLCAAGAALLAVAVAQL